MSPASATSDDTKSDLSERTPLLPPATLPAEGLSSTRPHDQPNVATQSNQHSAEDGVALTERDTSISWLRTAISTVALAGLIFLQATNISLLSTTQSSIAEALDAFDLASWFTSAYLIAMSALGPLNGKLAAVFSPRICIFTSSLILAVGTVVSGLSNDFTGFIAGRVVTGVGASGVFTISIIIVLESSSPKRRGLTIGLLNTGYTIGVAIGATAAGYLLPHTGWRWLFLGQAPIALFGGSVLLFSMPKNLKTRSKSSESLLVQVSRLDYLGALTLTLTIVLILYAMSSPKQIPILPLLLSPVSLATFVIIETYWASDPIIPVSLLRSRGLLFTCLGTVGYMMARWSVLFYAPTYAIAVKGWSSGSAGTIIIPTNTGFALGGLVVGWLHIRGHESFYFSTLIVYALFPLTLLGLSALVTRSSSIVLFVLDVFACGAVTGAALNYNLAHVLHLTPKSTHYIATSLLATFRGFSGSFGSAIGGGLFARTLHRSLEWRFAAHGLERGGLIRRLLGSPALVQQLEGLEHEVAVAGYEDALRVLFLAGAGLAAVTVLVQAATGWKGADEEKTVTNGNERFIDHREGHSTEEEV